MFTFSPAWIDDDYPHLYIVEYFMEGNDGDSYDISDCTLYII